MVESVETKKQQTSEESHYIMKFALKYTSFEFKDNMFPSDKFIFKHLPEAINKDRKVAKAVKVAVGAAAITTAAVLGGVVAPACMAIFGGLSAGMALYVGAISAVVGAMSGIVAFDEAKTIKEHHASGIGRHIAAKHIMQKKKDWSNDRQLKAKQAKEAKLIRQQNQTPSDQGKISSVLSGVNSAKDAWNNTVTDESKAKIQKGLDTAQEVATEKLNKAKDAVSDVASDAVDNTKRKMLKIVKKLRK